LVISGHPPSFCAPTSEFCQAFGLRSRPLRPAQTRFHVTYCDVITLTCRPLVSLQRNELLYSMQAAEGLSRDGHILLDSWNRRIPGGVFRLDQTPHADPEKSFRYAPAEVS
ncbi:hypothetical protein CHARACLAT_028337, partial [Characodon lateralis]|nr:hypothetical protein [Characodon lateralis]